MHSNAFAVFCTFTCVLTVCLFATSIKLILTEAAGREGIKLGLDLSTLQSLALMFVNLPRLCLFLPLLGVTGPSVLPM